MINIVIPMAGRGSRFVEAGYQDPKPLIPIHGVPMIKVVLKNLTPKEEHRFILICQEEHMNSYKLKEVLSDIPSPIEYITINEITEGQLSTVLKARSYIDNDNLVLTANSDQWIDFDINKMLKDFRERELDGSILTMKSDDPKWSYAQINDAGYVLETAEKKVISKEATVGIYLFKKGIDLLNSADQMIIDNIRVNNEFYICPVYNYLIQKKYKIGVYNIGEEYNGMYGLGIPKDLDFFKQHRLSREAIK